MLKAFNFLHMSFGASLMQQVRAKREIILTSDAADVVVEFLLEPRGLSLLLVEVLEVLIEDLICGSVYLSQVLQDL